MTKEKYSHNYGIKHFFEYFKKRKVKFPKTYFFNVKTRKKTLEVDFTLFKKTIATYLDFYFQDFYQNEESQYFFLSGKLEKARCKGVYKNSTETILTQPVCWVWTDRPSFSFCQNVKLTKLAGSNGKVYKLDKKYKRNFDSGILPSVGQRLKRAIKEKTFYKL